MPDRRDQHLRRQRWAQLTHCIPSVVLMRRIQGGTQSEQGNRWVERILSIRETLRLQDRSVLDYPIEAATATHHGRLVPSPLPP
jgi:transposase